MKIGKDRKIRENKKKQQKKPNKNPDFFVIDVTSGLIIILVGFFIGAILGWRIGGENGGRLGAMIGSLCFFGVAKFVEPDLIKFIENSNKTVITALNLIFLFLYAFVSIGGGIILSWYISGKVGGIFFIASSFGSIVLFAGVKSINVENK